VIISWSKRSLIHVVRQLIHDCSKLSRFRTVCLNYDINTKKHSSRGFAKAWGSQLVPRVIISPPNPRALVYVFNSKLSPGLPRFYYSFRWVPCRLLRETKREINFRKQSNKGLVNDVAPISRDTSVCCKRSCLDVRNNKLSPWGSRPTFYITVRRIVATDTPN
jgi:hypothetical protein